MPVDMKKYPANWQQIRRNILLRAGGSSADPRIGARCEWCGALNYSVIIREHDGSSHYAGGNLYLDTFQYATSYKDARDLANSENECAENGRAIVIVLTIAHIQDHDPQSVAHDNLAALCQRCHNRHDNRMRVQHAARKRKAKRLGAQPELFTIE